MYFNMDNDHADSPYSDWWCNDDVNGGGVQVMPDLRSLELAPGYYNNVGEPESHPSPPFVDDLSRFFSAHPHPDIVFHRGVIVPDDSAWEAVLGFYGSNEPMAGKWIQMVDGRLKFGSSG